MRKIKYKIEDDLLIEVTSIFKVNLNSLDFDSNLYSKGKLEDKIGQQLALLYSLSEVSSLEPILNKIKLLKATTNSKSVKLENQEEDIKSK